MYNSLIKVNAHDISESDLKAMVSSQIQLAALTEMSEAARHNKIELTGSSLREKYFSQVKKIIS